MALLTLITKLRYGSAAQFTVGYLTGSERRPGDEYYDRPGRAISGAITIAVEEVNQLHFNPLGHSLKFKVSFAVKITNRSNRMIGKCWPFGTGFTDIPFITFSLFNIDIDKFLD